MPRFTISHHTGSKEGDHYDLFLEDGDKLRTWRIQDPNFDTEQDAIEIDPHRKDYLDFEGEISGNRGRVRIVETGEYTAEGWSTDLVVVELRGRRDSVNVRMERMAEHSRTWFVEVD